MKRGEGGSGSRCMKCKEEAIYRRPYSGERFCKSHFIASIERRVYSAIRRYHMLTRTDRVAVALSGGKDSTSLLHILQRLEARYPQVELVALTVDEGIAGYRDEAIEIARRNCRMLGVEQHIVSFKELYGLALDEVVDRARSTLSELTPCSYCSVLRRKALNIGARRVGASKVALGHNLDDVAQTFLINLLHGDTYRLAWTGPYKSEECEAFPQRVRPMAEVPEAETTLYAYLKGVELQSYPCPYSGTSLRSEVRTFLKALEGRHPGVTYSMLRSFEKVREAVKLRLEPSELRTCISCGEPSIGERCKPCQMLIELGVEEPSRRGP